MEILHSMTAGLQEAFPTPAHILNSVGLPYIQGIYMLSSNHYTYRELLSKLSLSARCITYMCTGTFHMMINSYGHDSWVHTNNPLTYLGWVPSGHLPLHVIFMRIITLYDINVMKGNPKLHSLWGEVDLSQSNSLLIMNLSVLPSPSTGTYDEDVFPLLTGGLEYRLSVN